MSTTSYVSQRCPPQVLSQGSCSYQPSVHHRRKRAECGWLALAAHCCTPWLQPGAPWRPATQPRYPGWSPGHAGQCFWTAEGGRWHTSGPRRWSWGSALPQTQTRPAPWGHNVSPFGGHPGTWCEWWSSQPRNTRQPGAVQILTPPLTAWVLCYA